jgi:hypothetical protein
MVTVFIFSSKYDILERLVAFSRQHENWELDEFISMSVFIMFAMIFFSVRRWKQVRYANNLLLQLNKNLQNAFTEIKQLKGIIPICAECKKIRDDEGFWHQVESYVRDHSEAEFSHGICPECMKKLYPEYAEKEE